MKNFISIFFVLFVVGFSSLNVQAQCPTITCPSNSTVNNDNGVCEAVVSYTAPVVTDPCNTNTVTFNYTGAMETWVVPTGVTTITVDAYGAQGGANWVNNDNFGGHVQADLTVTPGATLNIYVGEQPNGLTGGWNGGGDGESAGQGGGGASDIRIGGTTLNDRVIVAGAGGGAGYWSSQHVVGGVGGGLIGGAGYRDSPTNPGGDPGTQTSSGNGTCASFNNPSVSGGFGFGGSPSGCGCEGYGGGAGWYGGAGSGNCRGGGGGSSYTDPGLTSNVTHNQGTQVGNGQIVITYTTSSNLTTTQLAGNASGAAFPVGTTTNTFEVSDGNGNTAQCSFDVTVEDVEDPVADNANLADVEASCEVNTLTAPTATDVCDGTLTGVSDAVFPIDNDTVVVWTYTDAAGNAVTQNQNVVITGVDVAVSLSGTTITADNGNADSYQWINCADSSTVTDATGQSFTPSANGDYAVIVTEGNCSDTSTCESVTTVGIEDFGNQQSISIYPNPNNGQFTVNFEKEVTEAEIKVYDLQGRIVVSYTTKNASAQIINLEEQTGTFMISITTQDGTQNVKVVVQ